MTAVYKELVDRLPEIAKVVNLFDSESVQQQAFGLLADAIGSPAPKSTAPKLPKKKAGTPDSTKKRTKKRKASGPTLVKDLDLRPKTGTTWKDFSGAKAPRNYNEKSTVAIYYLIKTAKVAAVTTDHVYTAYKDAGWKVPANLPNHLQSVASTKAWIDTSSMADIKLTIAGENFVEHDLPKQPKN